MIMTFLGFRVLYLQTSGYLPDHLKNWQSWKRIEFGLGEATEKNEFYNKTRKWH